MNAPPLIGAAVTALAAGAVAAFQETVGAPEARRPVGEIVTIIAAVGTLAGIIGGIIVQVVTLRVKSVIAPVVASVASVEAKADVIKSSVDGTASRMEAALGAALRENERLIVAASVQKTEQVAAVLAASQAAQPAPARSPDALTREGDSHAEEHLKQIEVNTDATAKNTEKTDATVSALQKKIKIKEP